MISFSMIQWNMSFLEGLSLSFNLFVVLISLSHTIITHNVQSIVRLFSLLTVTTVVLYLVILLGLGMFT